MTEGPTCLSEVSIYQINIDFFLQLNHSKNINSILTFLYTGGKGHPTVDGGIRVPTVIRFPGIIPRGKVIDEPTQQLDMFTTITKLIGGKIPSDRVIDGKDMLPLLQFKESKSPHKFMYHYCGEHLQATRYRPPQGDILYKATALRHPYN